jgi:hypothetical protein
MVAGFVQNDDSSDEHETIEHLEDGTQQVTFVHRKSASGTPHSSAPITRGVTPQPSPIADNVGAVGLSLMPPLDSSSASVNLFQAEKNIRVCQKKDIWPLVISPRRTVYAGNCTALL